MPPIPKRKTTNSPLPARPGSSKLGKAVDPSRCVACEGTGKSSKGWECVPCHGTGKDLGHSSKCDHCPTPAKVHEFNASTQRIRNYCGKCYDKHFIPEHQRRVGRIRDG